MPIVASVLQCVVLSCSESWLGIAGWLHPFCCKSVAACCSVMHRFSAFCIEFRLGKTDWRDAYCCTWVAVSCSELQWVAVSCSGFRKKYRTALPAVVWQKSCKGQHERRESCHSGTLGPQRCGIVWPKVSKQTYMNPKKPTKETWERDLVKKTLKKNGEKDPSKRPLKETFKRDLQKRRMWWLRLVGSWKW